MAAITDTTLVAAFAVGMISFLSPCVLPLVPGYLSTISGVAIGDLREGGRSNTLAVLVPSVLFCLSFTIMFVALGMTASGLGSLLNENRTLLNRVAGLVIIAMGVFFVAAPFVSMLNRTWHPEALMARAGVGGPLVAGAAFAVAWTPCIGPTLAAVLAAAATQATVGRGGVLLAFYSAGLAIPFLATALAFNGAGRLFGWVRRHYLEIAMASGIIMIAMGVLVFTDRLFYLNSEIQRLLDSLGVNFFQNV